MVFKFITDSTGLTVVDVAVMAYNLALTYFYYDIMKFVLSAFRARIKGGKV